MWETDHTKVHIAGLDAEGDRLTEHARATLRASLFGGILCIDIDVHEGARILDTGLVTQFAIYDHCGHEYGQRFSFDEPYGVRRSWASTTIRFNEIKITLR